MKFDLVSAIVHRWFLHCGSHGFVETEKLSVLSLTSVQSPLCSETEIRPVVKSNLYASSAIKTKSVFCENSRSTVVVFSGFPP